MRTIEFAGAVGSGKSTLAPELVRLLREAGIDAVGQTDALAGLVSRRVGLAVDAPHGAAFAATHPRLMLLVARVLARAATDRSHRRRIAGLVLRLGARRQFLESTLAPDRTVVIDEGFVQRAVNVFAWAPGPLPVRDLARYFRLAPIGDVVVMVQVDGRVARGRARARGLPQRVAAKPVEEAERFLARAEQVVDAAGRVLQSLGVPTIVVNNDGTREGAVDALRGHLPQLAGAAQPPRMKFGPLALSRPRRRGRAAVTPTGLEAAMDALGIGTWRLLRPLGRATGRSGSALVETPAGPLVLKRYKASVPIDQVRVEHEILRELEALQFPAPRLRASSDGTTIIDASGAMFAAFGYLDGYRRSDDVLRPGWLQPATARLHGSALGALHAALAGFVPETTSPHGLDRNAPGRRARDLQWHEDLLDEVERSPRAPRLREELAELRHVLPESDARVSAAELSAGVVHGDFGPYNVLIRDGAPLFIVDYELARLDWRVVDLAAALPRYLGRRRGRDAERRLSRFLDGYRSKVGLLPQELRALPAVLAFLSLRRAAVLLGRWIDQPGDAAPWEVIEKLMLARTIAAGDHVIARVARTF
ncbi:MAG: phosphotransferase [Chloroflexota bacterium]